MSNGTALRSEITQRIMTALESGGLPPWRRPWSNDGNSGMPTNVASGRSYSGVNPLLLQVAAEQFGFTSRWWGTYRQWQSLGGQVARRPPGVPSGEWGTRIVFCAPIDKTKTDRWGNEVEERFWMLRSFVVFNVEQVEGNLDHLRCGRTDTRSEVEQRFHAADRAFEATGADIRFGGNRAFYDGTGDFIQMPRRDQFSIPEYYETLAHELVHWTEHPSRLAWDRSAYGGHAYALGELIAEIGGCYLCGELGVPIVDRLDNHVAYLQHWLEAMRADASFIFKATTQASKAADYLLSFSRERATEPVSGDCE